MNKELIRKVLVNLAVLLGSILIVINQIFCYRKNIVQAELILAAYLSFGLLFLPFHRWLLRKWDKYEHVLLSIVFCFLFYGGVLVFILGVLNKNLASKQEHKVVVPLSANSGTYFGTDAVGCRYQYTEFEIENTTRDIKIDCDESFPSGGKAQITYLEGWLGVKVILKKEIVE